MIGIFGLGFDYIVVTIGTQVQNSKEISCPSGAICCFPIHDPKPKLPEQKTPYTQPDQLFCLEFLGFRGTLTLIVWAKVLETLETLVTLVRIIEPAGCKGQAVSRVGLGSGIIEKN